MEKNKIFADEITIIGESIDIEDYFSSVIEGRQFPFIKKENDRSMNQNVKKLKKPKTIEQQIMQLKHHGVYFTEEELKKATVILGEINYYRISIYRHLLGNDISFTQMMDLYNFDKYLRNEITILINPIEEMLRTKLAYFLSIYYPYGIKNNMNVDSSLCYKDKTIYKCNEKREVKKFLDACCMNVDRHKSDEDIQHYLSHYDGEIPIWVLVEHLSLGNISTMIRLLDFKVLKLLNKTSFRVDGKTIMAEKMIPEWANTIRELRNCCAHLSRLYGKNRGYSPNLNPFKNDINKYYSEDTVDIENLKHTLLGGMLIMKKFYSLLSSTAY